MWGPYLPFPGGPEGQACLSLPPLLQRHYGQYHGFVVIHGTDTMAFAASVLSFMLENLQKTVILTGAQVTTRAAQWAQGPGLPEATGQFSAAGGPGGSPGSLLGPAAPGAGSCSA